MKKPITDIKVKTAFDLEAEYKDYVARHDGLCLDLAEWIPAFGDYVRPLMPGELCIIMADTGVGKTGIVQNIATACGGLDFLMFELELPGTLCFERFAAMTNDTPSWVIERDYRAGKRHSTAGFHNVDVVDEASMSPGRMQELVAYLKDTRGKTYQVLIVDYIGLLDCTKGRSRYERMSEAAAQLKVLARETNTVVLAVTQIHRKGDEPAETITLHDAKDSSSIEQSAGLLLGAWREPDDPSVMHIKILKNTKGQGGKTIMARMDGQRMTIKQHEQYSQFRAEEDGLVNVVDCAPWEEGVL